MIWAALFTLAMLVAMAWDIATYEIPDSLSILLVLVAVAGILSGDGGLERIVGHGTAGITAFAVGAALFIAGQWGGGDVKFLGAASLWFGWSHLPAYLLSVAVIGGLFTVLLLVFRAVPLPAWATAPAWVARLRRRDQGVPYGVALGLGGLVQVERAVAALAA